MRERRQPTDDELVARYAAAAAAHHRATEEGSPRDVNRQHDIIAEVYRELRRRGVESQRRLLPLLVHPDPGVRSWAAAHALEFSPADGEPVLEAMSGERGLTGFNAKMTLAEWRKGHLKFP